jgi:acetyl esterase/lipase
MSLVIDPSVFDPATRTPESRAFNAKLSAMTVAQPRWYEIGAAKFRKLRAEGAANFPPLIVVDSAVNFEIPSRDAARKIPCRVFKPSNGDAPRALFMHIHGGGWVLGSESTQDVQLQRIVDAHSIVCVSVGYRLAPEHPFPAGPEDCYDVAEWLVRHATDSFQAPLAFIGGDSAGGHLSLLTSLHLLQHSDPVFSGHRLRGLILHYGCFSLRFLPGVYHFAKREPNLILSLEIITEFREAFLGEGWTQEMLDDPKISPLHADLSGLRHKLPPALFTCGTEDYLLDDTLFMSARWHAAGGQTSVAIINGAAHAFTAFDPAVKGSGAAEGNRVTDKFLQEQLS